tara:strand:+ start:1298 stop:1696 length:399 start_codon:yes stop_codon:yes gene_type:complete
MKQPKDYFLDKSTGEIKSGKFFKMWHKERSKTTGSRGSDPDTVEEAEKLKEAGRKGGKNSSCEKKYPVSKDISDSEILKQLNGYMSDLTAEAKKSMPNHEKKPFTKAITKIRHFIGYRVRKRKFKFNHNGKN